MSMRRGRVRVLHVVKNSSGAGWAAREVRELMKLGVDVHVALPSLDGRDMPIWRESGAQLHVCDLSFPTLRPWRIPDAFSRVRRVVDEVRPEIIHTHFVTSTLTVRGALGRNHPIPRIFQVAGPLHMEHAPYRMAEIALAGSGDYWIASSQYTRTLYSRARVDPNRVFLSYYGFDPRAFDRPRTGILREKLGIPSEAMVVGNVSLIYKPKFNLGQFIGLKAHEHVIEALRTVTRRRSDVFGVLVGGPWGKGQRYFERLRSRAARLGEGRILMPGFCPPQNVPEIWPDFDCAVHVPLSENCGGVVEPLAAGVPTIAGLVGGLPEVVIDNITGKTVPIRKPNVLADAILEVLDDLPRYRGFAVTGQNLVRNMFSAERTASEVSDVYDYILGHSTVPPMPFDSRAFVQAHAHAEQSRRS